MSDGLDDIDISNPINTAHPLAHGLIGLWLPISVLAGSRRFYDLAAYRVNGLLVNMTPATAWKRTAFGWALDFNGTNNYVDLGTRLPQSLRLTIAAWINPRDVSPADGRTIVGRWIADDGWWFRFKSGLLHLEAPNDCFYAGTSTIPTNKWSHVAVTVSGTNVTFYINGVRDVTCAQIAPLTTSAKIVYIGVLPIFPYYQRYFNGLMREVRIYNRALTAQEMQLLYHDSYTHRYEFLNRVQHYWPVSAVHEALYTRRRQNTARSGSREAFV